MAYEVAEAFVRIVPSFTGVASAIEDYMARAGVPAARSFARTFAPELARLTGNARLGPADSATARQGGLSGRTFADAFKARVDAALRTLPDIQLGADSTAADARIVSIREKLRELSGQRIGIDIDEAAAVARIEELHRQLTELARETPSVSVKADTINAARQLDQLRLEIDRIANSDPDVDVRVNTGDADAKLAATKAEADSLGGSSPSIDVSVITGPALSAIGVIRTALLALSAGAAITPLIGGVASLLGPLAGIGGGLAGIAAVGVPAISKVNDALGAQKKAEDGAGSAATKSGAQQEAAANQVKSAELSLADTRRRVANDQVSSAESVRKAVQANAQAQTDAERSVAQAVRATTDAQTQAARDNAQASAQVVAAEDAVATADAASLAAQKALTDAREAGARSLEDSAFAAQDAALQLQADQLAVTDAQRNLAAVTANSASTDEDKQRATLALAQAQQSLAEQQVTAQRATEDNTAAQQAGVDGTPQVVSAYGAISSAQTAAEDAAKNLSDAQAAQTLTAQQGAQRVQDAQQAEARARQDATQKIQAAEQALADARRARQQQAAQDASDTIRAQQAVTQAQLAAATAATASGTAAAGLSSALAKLTPQERALYDATQKFKSGAFADFKSALEPTVIPLFTQGLKILSDLLPRIEPLIKAVADAIRPLLTSLDNAIKGPGFKKFINTLTTSVGPAIATIGKIAGNIGSVFAHVVEAFAPLAQVVLQGVQQLTGGLAKATSGPGLKDFANTLIQLGPIIVQSFSHVGRVIGQLGGLFAHLAGPVFSVIDQIATSISTLIAAVGPSLTRLFATLAPAINTVVRALAPFLAQVVNALAPVLGQIATTLAPILAKTLQAIEPAIKPLASLFGTIVKAVAPILPMLGQLLGQVLPPLAAAFSSVVTALIPLQPVISAVLSVITTLLAAAGPLIKFLSPLAPLIVAIVVGVKAVTIAIRLWTIVQGILNAVLTANPIGLIVAAIAALVAGFILAWNHSETFRKIVVAVLNAVKAAFVAVIHFLVAAFRDFIGAVTTAWRAIGTAIRTAWNSALSFVKSIYQSVANFLKNAWTVFVGVVKNAWDNITRPIRQLWNAVVSGVRTAWTTVRDFLSTSFHAFVGIVSSVWHAITYGITHPFSLAVNAVRSAWTTVRDFLANSFHAFVDVAHRIWTSIAGAIGKAFGSIRHTIADIWYDVEKVFAGAVNFVTQDILNPLIRLLNKVLGVFNVHIGTINPITITPPSKSYSQGGVQPGYAPGTDSVLAWLSPGEGVLVPEAVRGIGGVAGVQQINSLFSARVSPPNFSGGGGVPEGRRRKGNGLVLSGKIDPNDSRIVHESGADDGLFDGPLAHVVSSGVEKAIAAIRRGAAAAAIAALKVAEEPVKALISGANSTLGRRLSTGVFDKINAEVYDYIRGNTAAVAAKQQQGNLGGPTTGNSLTYAKVIIDQARALGLGRKGAEIGLMTGLVESGLKNDANSNIPESLRLPHDAVGSDHYSAGIMQQQTGPFGNYWGTVPQVMNPTYAAHRFFVELMRKVSNFASLDSGVAAQTVQVSQFPDAYQSRQGDADALIQRIGYDAGGLLPAGVSSVINNTGRPEIIAPASTFAELAAQVSGFGGDPSVQVFIGDEAIDPRMVRISHQVVDSRVQRAGRRQSAGVAGGPIAHLGR